MKLFTSGIHNDEGMTRTVAGIEALSRRADRTGVEFAWGGQRLRRCGR